MFMSRLFAVQVLVCVGGAPQRPAKLLIVRIARFQLTRTNGPARHNDLRLHMY